MTQQFERKKFKKKIEKFTFVLKRVIPVNNDMPSIFSTKTLDQKTYTRNTSFLVNSVNNSGIILFFIIYSIRFNWKNGIKRCLCNKRMKATGVSIIQLE